MMLVLNVHVSRSIHINAGFTTGLYPWTYMLFIQQRHSQCHQFQLDIYADPLLIVSQICLSM